MSEPRTETGKFDAEKFWDTHCGDCAHDLHPMNVCATIVGGDQNGPDYCSCTLDYQSLAAEYQRTKAAPPPLDGLREALRLMASQWEEGAGSDPSHPAMAKVWRQCAYELRAALRDEGETT